MAENEFVLNKDAQVKRRSILKAGAWAVPVIAVAAAAPAAAVSGEPPLPPRYFSQDIRLAQGRIDNVVNVLRVVEGFSVFQGAPGMTAGYGIVRVVVPVGYTWAPDPALAGWTALVDTTTSGLTRYNYTTDNEMIIAAGQNTISIPFAGGELTGNGASTTNQARLYTGTTVYAGIDSQFPSEG